VQLEAQNAWVQFSSRTGEQRELVL